MQLPFFFRKGVKFCRLGGYYFVVQQTITPALKKQLTNSIHQTMADLYPYKGKKLKLQTIMQRQIYRFCSCIVKGNCYRGYHFKW